jgi:hypothetical protein
MEMPGLSLDDLIKLVRSGEEVLSPSGYPIFRGTREEFQQIIQHQYDIGDTKNLKQRFGVMIDTDGHERFYRSDKKDLLPDGRKKLAWRSIGKDRVISDKRALKIKEGTPTLEDFHKAWDPVDPSGETAKRLYKEERKRIRHQEKVRDQLNEEYRKRKGTTNKKDYKWTLDHNDPADLGGRNISRNLRIEELSRNVGGGKKRPLTDLQRNQLLLPRDNVDAVRIEGPEPTPLQRQQISRNEPIKPKPKPSRGLEVSPAKALRIARMGAPLALSLGFSAAAMGTSAHAAWEDPTANNIEDAAWDTVNFTADALSLIPILAAPMEGAQKLLGWGHLSRMATRDLNVGQQASMYKNGGYTAD